MQRSFASLALLLLGSNLGTIVPMADRVPPAVLVMTAIFGGYLCVTAARAWRVRLGAADSVTGMVLAGVSALAYVVPTELVLPMATRGNAVVVATLLAAGFLRTRLAVVSCLVLVLVYFATALPVDGLAGAAEGLWPILASPLAAGAVSRVLRRAASRADEAQVSVHAARVLSASSEARRAAHKQFQRTLHDDVAAALRAVTTLGLDPEAVRQACATAMIRAEAAPVPPSSEVEDLRAGLDLLPGPAGTKVERLPGPRVLVSGEVVRAVLDAAREVLANVGRHAKATVVVIELVGDREGFVLLIRDDGVGFRTDMVRRTSLGLRESVIGRLAEMGGTADVRSAPGEGTTVELRWSRPRGEPLPPVVKSTRLRGMTAAVDDLRQPLAAVCLPYLASMVLPVVSNLDAAPGMGWLAAWYGILTAGTVLLIMFACKAVPLAVGVLAGVWAGGGAAAALLVIPADSLTNFASWPIGATGPMLVVLGTLWRWPLSVAALFVEEVPLLGMIASGAFVTRSYTDALPAVTAPMLALVMGLVITNTIARLGGVVLAAGAERTEIAVSTAARDSRLSVHAKRIAEIGAEILPFLRWLATADRAAFDLEETRVRARGLEWMARDELHIPGVLDTRLRHLLMTARDSGCVVTVQADTDTLHPPSSVRVVLDAALSTSPMPRELILSLSTEGSGVLISLVCQPHDRARADALRTALPSAAVTEYEAEAIAVELLVALDT
ncbi:signal transduction histidine kinase [Umezawaea tangerina]|uniref:Signal transduction histidine kinase n=2 Tax=Umezawaea tangerina TaxID=84725 RepID=A0A2T0SNY2_9PSEU|nr:signal transduction histidine kinase [Umezawaea tangerina]